MLSRDERLHVHAIKQWSEEMRRTRDAAEADSKLHGIIQKILTLSGNREDPWLRMLENLDWLIRIVERETHREGVRNLLRSAQR